MDSSDGLAYTLFEIAYRSNVCMELNCLPQHLPPEYVFYSGEEYLPVFTVPQKSLHNMEKILRKRDIPFMEIGTVKQVGKCEKRGEVYYNGRKIEPRGYEHLWSV